MLWDELQPQVDVNSIQVRPFDGFIFVCGGPYDNTENIKSARHYAVWMSGKSDKKLAGRTVLLAEDLTKLLRESDYPDFIEFEAHLAALAACVVIFLESAGSIAELGSFSVMKNLAEKLFVVCDQTYESATNPSFIFLGPLQMVRRHGAERVQVFPMLGEPVCCTRPVSKERLDECWIDIEAELQRVVRRPVAGTRLDTSNIAHQMLTICALCELFGALRVSEILEIMKKLGFSSTLKSVRRQLLLLEQFEMLKQSTYSSEAFCYSIVEKKLLSFPSANAERLIFDEARFRAAMIDRYKTKDEKKWRAIRSFYRQPAKQQ